MIGMSVRQCVQSDLPAPKPTKNPWGREPCGRVDQHFAQQVDVDRIGRKAFEDVEVVGQLLHR